MNVNGRKLQRFRCTVDPMIPPKPRNAFDNGPKGDCRGWEFTLTPAGVYVKAIVVMAGKSEPYVEEHVIPYANIQSMKLLPEEPKKTDEQKKLEEQEKAAKLAAEEAEGKKKADAAKTVGR